MPYVKMLTKDMNRCHTFRCPDPLQLNSSKQFSSSPGELIKKLTFYLMLIHLPKEQNTLISPPFYLIVTLSKIYCF